MKKLSSIILGWWYYLTNRRSKTARTRLKICSSCEFRRWFICGQCFCPLQSKARSDDDCPKGKWPKLKHPVTMLIMTETDEELYDEIIELQNKAIEKALRDT